MNERSILESLTRAATLLEGGLVVLAHKELEDTIQELMNAEPEIEPADSGQDQEAAKEGTQSERDCDEVTRVNRDRVQYEAMDADFTGEGFEDIPF